MPGRNRKRREEPALLFNECSSATYNKLCRKCRHECKQSGRVQLAICPKFLSKQAAGPPDDLPPAA